MRFDPELVFSLVILLLSGALSAVSCGDTLIANTTLSGDLLNCPGHGLIIGADNVTLDCAGKSIAYTQGIGCAAPGCMAVATNANNATVKNCVIHNYSIGIFTAANDSTMLNNTIYNISLHGAFASGALRASMIGNNVSNCGIIGLLFFQNSYGGLAINNTAGNSLVGLAIVNSSGVFESNTLMNSSVAGAAFLRQSSNSTLRNNSILDNYAGIWLAEFGAFSSNATNITVENNTVSGSFMGVYISNATGNYFLHNSFLASTNYSFANNQSYDVNASLNYWGTTDLAGIADLIYDKDDDPGLGSVTFQPILYAPYGTSPPQSEVGQVSITIESTNRISVYTSNGTEDSTMSFKSMAPVVGGTLLNTSNASDMADSEIGFYVENQGNININVTVASNVTAAEFVTGTSPSFKFYGNETKPGACSGALATSGTEFAASATDYELCSELQSGNSQD